MKVWDGRFSKETAKIANDFNSSIKVDSALYYEDISGSIAHVTMLSDIGILNASESKQIVTGLKKIYNDILNGEIVIDLNEEDIHVFIEKKLVEQIGEVGKKMHTARSRNDQVQLDVKIYILKTIRKIKELLKNNIEALLKMAKNNFDVIMPGYTHLQHAQPILLSHYFLAYIEMFKRDYKRLTSTYEIADEMPLGVAALAGTSYNIDRNLVADLLGFNNITKNSLDTVSDRDYLIQFLSDLSIIMMHLSRLSEEMILWATSEFNYIEIDDAFSTGSSIMPQKKNPDMFELIRGKTGRVYGNLMAMLTIMKGLPLAYNKDMQEDKEIIFSSVKTVQECLSIIPPMLGTIKFNKEEMYEGCKTGYIQATEIADYLAKKGMPFRDAHRITGNIIAYAVVKGIDLNQIGINEYKSFSVLIKEDVYDCLDIKKIIENKKSEGGTSYESIRRQIKVNEEFLKNEKN